MNYVRVFHEKDTTPDTRNTRARNGRTRTARTRNTPVNAGFHNADTTPNTKPPDTKTDGPGRHDTDTDTDSTGQRRCTRRSTPVTRRNGRTRPQPGQQGLRFNVQTLSNTHNRFQTLTHTQKWCSNGCCSNTWTGVQTAVQTAVFKRQPTGGSSGCLRRFCCLSSRPIL